MKNLKRTHLFPMAGICALGLFAPSAQADFFIHSWDNHHTTAQRLQAGADFLWYRTATNFDSTGSSFTPFGLDSYQRYLLELDGIYGVTQNLSLYGRLGLEMSKVDSTNPLAFTGTTSGLGDQTLGINYRVYEKPHSAAIDLQGQLDFPGYSNSATKTTPYLGDASVDGTAGAFITFLMSDKTDAEVRLVGGAGYTYRSKNFSSEIPWSAFVQYAPKKEGVIGSAGLFGIQSLNNDNHPNNTLLLDTSAGSLGTGGSYITGAINPSLMSIRAQAGYQTASDVQFTGTFSQALWGKNAPSGMTLAFGVQTHFGENSESKETPPPPRGASRLSRAQQGYVNYNLEAKVLRANDRFALVKIDKGADNGVNEGDTFDIFMTNPNGSVGSVIARGRVTSVKANEAAIKVEEYFKEVWIEEGFVARRPIE